jgi:hypothetical protein
MTYQELCPIDASQEERRYFYIGNIFENKAKCLKCGDVIISKNVHDYSQCKCGNLAVDGGSWYAKRTYHEENSYEDMIVYYNRIDLFIKE